MGDASVDYAAKLNPGKALIWRIVHRDNLPWILDNGLHCGNSSLQAPGWVSIGNPELIGSAPTTLCGGRRVVF
ncbi:MAG: DarT ssDNA thymidine ADP-ribosyltransferase family protein [Herbaspirillum sp.]